MPRKSMIEEMGADIEPEDIEASGMLPPGWTIEVRENRGKGSHSYFWSAQYRDCKPITSRYLQMVLGRLFLLEYELREEEGRR